MLLAVTSPEGRYDTTYLSNYATISFQEELSRSPGVGEVLLYGASEVRLRIWLDADRLAARGLTAADVVRAVAQQNIQAAPESKNLGAGSKESPLVVNTLGRLVDAESLGEVILKTDARNQQIRLKDVALVQRRGPHRAVGQPRRPARGSFGNLLHFGGSPGRGDARVQKMLTEPARPCAEGIRLEVAFDFTPDLEAAAGAATPGYLLVDPQLPDSASPERVREALHRCQTILKEVPGVGRVLILSDHPFDRVRDRPCILMGLVPAAERRLERERVKHDIRSRLQELREMAAHLRDLSGPGVLPQGGYPLALALQVPSPIGCSGSRSSSPSGSRGASSSPTSGQAANWCHSQPLRRTSIARR